MGEHIGAASLGTYVREDVPATNYNASVAMWLREGSGNDAISYLYWSRPFPLGVTILTAKIVLYTAAMVENVAHTLNLQRINQTWSQSTMKWTTRPTALLAGTKPVTKSGPQPEATAWEFNVADWMQTVSNGGVWQGVQVKTTEAILRKLYSEVHASTQYRPRLEVTWSDEPQIPTGLAPSGGRAVSLAKPVVRATFLDVSGSTTLAAVQVQVNATDVWTAPTFDSGAVLTSVPELDLARTDMPGGVYAGLADGATTFWRVRFQDGAGLWSPWSLAVTFKRDTHGTLTLDNPPSGTPVVEDVTPPILWTFTGEVQAFYQIWIQHITNGVLITDWTSGKVQTVSDDVTVPEGKITSSAVTYILTLRVWDNKQREATPGDTVHVEVVRNFTFVPGATTGTTGLTAVADPIAPKVVLTWQRATAPDRFNVLRNGQVIAAALSPDTQPDGVHVSGTTYSWTDHSPSPGRVQTYSVQAVVNNVASSSNASAAVTVKTWGIWLRDPTSGLELAIVDKDSRSFVLGESAAVFRPVSARGNPVVINQNLSGLEGRISGALETTMGKTAQQWRDIYFKLRELGVRKFYLTVGDYTFLAVCHEFTYEPLAVPQPRFKISFQFYQQDSVNSIQLGS